MTTETPATLRRKEAIAHRAGWFRLEAIYLMERAKLEAELVEPPTEEPCPCCHGAGETEADTYRLDEYGEATRWRVCHVCDGSGTVLTDEPAPHEGEVEREEDRLGRGGWDWRA